MQKIISLFLALFLCCCNTKNEPAWQSQSTAMESVSIFSPAWQELLVHGKGLCRPAVQPRAMAMDSCFYSGLMGTQLLMAAALLGNEASREAFYSAFPHGKLEELDSPRGFQTVAGTLSEYFALVVREAQDSTIKEKALAMEEFLRMVQGVFYSRLGPLYRYLDSFENQGPMEKHLALMAKALIFKHGTANNVPFTYTLSAILETACPNAAFDISLLLCVPAKKSVVFGECEDDLNLISKEVIEKSREISKNQCVSLAQIRDDFSSLLSSLSIPDAGLAYNEGLVELAQSLDERLEKFSRVWGH